MMNRERKDGFLADFDNKQHDPYFDEYYDEYILEHWTSPIPEFSVTNTFILRYSYDAHNSVDQMASNQGYFETFMKKSDWSDYFRINPPYLKMNTFITEKRRVIILCSDVENLILGESFLK